MDIVVVIIVIQHLKRRSGRLALLFRRCDRQRRDTISDSM